MPPKKLISSGRNSIVNDIAHKFETIASSPAHGNIETTYKSEYFRGFDAKQHENPDYFGQNQLRRFSKQTNFEDMETEIVKT